MKKLEVGWGFGDILSKDKICFCGNGVAIIQDNGNKDWLFNKNIEDLVFNKIVDFLKTELPKHSSDNIIEQGNILIKEIISHVNQELLEMNQNIKIMDIVDWKFEPPEDYKDLYSKIKMKDAAGVDINKLYQIQTLSNSIKDREGTINIDLSNKTNVDLSNKINVQGNYVQGDVKTIQGDEISGSGQKVNIENSVLLRSNIGSGADRNICPHCNEKIEPNWKACPKCGNKL